MRHVFMSTVAVLDLEIHGTSKMSDDCAYGLQVPRYFSKTWKKVLQSHGINVVLIPVTMKKKLAT